MATKVALIKTGALGDVVRTTSLVIGLHRVLPDLELTWITSEGATPLLRGNPYIARIVLAQGSSSEPWRRDSYDWVISLDDEDECCALASSLTSRRLSGAYKAGDKCFYTPDLEPWFGMGLLRPADRGGLARANELKRLNHESFASLLYRSLELPLPIARPFLAVSDAALCRASRIIAESRPSNPMIALNTGAGGRWRYKSWGESQTAELACAIIDHLSASVILLGGLAEKERNRRILDKINRKSAFAAPTDLDLESFAALIKQSDAIVVSDSLSLHIATALEKRIVAFFGPTSAAEIDLFGLGEKVETPLECHTCYLKTCNVEPNCMEAISVQRLFEATARQLKLACAPLRSAFGE